jgi:hypothetical protein
LVPRSTDELVDEIRRYCLAHSHALDTLEGIAWWIAMQRFEEVRAVVHSAVDRLVDEGVLVRYRTQDNVTVFGCCVNKDDSAS